MNRLCINDDQSVRKDEPTTHPKEQLNIQSRDRKGLIWSSKLILENPNGSTEQISKLRDTLMTCDQSTQVPSDLVISRLQFEFLFSNVPDSAPCIWDDLLGSISKLSITTSRVRRLHPWKISAILESSLIQIVVNTQPTLVKRDCNFAIEPYSNTDH